MAEITAPPVARPSEFEKARTLILSAVDQCLSSESAMQDVWKFLEQLSNAHEDLIRFDEVLFGEVVRRLLPIVSDPRRLDCHNDLINALSR